MENHVITDADIREYLLGFLDIGSEIVEQIDVQLLTEPEFSIRADVLEDEIIEEYIEGLLAADDLKAVETHFLRPPERQTKLKNARLLARHFAVTPSGKISAGKSGTVLPFTAKHRQAQPAPHLRTYAEIAALVLFTVPLLYLLNQRHHLMEVVKQDSQQLAQERQHSASLNPRLQSTLRPAVSSIVTLTLLEPGLIRGTSYLSEADISDASTIPRPGVSALPEAQISDATTILHIEVALTSPAGKYHVQLEQAGTVTWSSRNEDAVKVQGGAVLKVDIPAASLPNGTCELSIVSQRARKLSYWFRVKKEE